MEQASRILAGWSAASDLISRERIALSAWKKAVGKRLADRTRAVKLVRDRLVVEVEDEVWRANLWSLRFQIMRNLAKAVGPGVVADLEFRVMPPRREPQRETRAPLFDAPATSPAVENDDSAGIADPGLRRIYRNSVRRHTA